MDIKEQGRIIIPHNGRISISGRECIHCNINCNRAFTIRIGISLPNVQGGGKDIFMCVNCVGKIRDEILAGRDFVFQVVVGK